MSILDLLGFGGQRTKAAESRADTETVRKIVSELDHLPRDRARFVASFAYILGRVAHADSDISDEETRAMERIVCRHGHLPEEQAVIIVQMAKTQTLLFGGTENFLVTREFSEIATREEKLSLLECLFAVSAADERVSATEDNAIRQIADELKLDHSEFIAVRSRFREHLGVLRKPE
ncbi:MAG: TerB family tellurite resistance protein [bacterium]|nr:TerB family tellurite resistance protein [bacterium]